MDIKNCIKILKAMSDPARLNLLKILSEKELCVREIEEVVNMKQTTVSQQLRRLKEAGLVIERKEGWWSYYSLDSIVLDEFMKTFKDFFASPVRSVTVTEKFAEEKIETSDEYRKMITFREKEFID